ncbi:MAG: hypothetical protein FWG30_12135 [Eubacteriaceae bacterium]|nr:hypothetical protein [Eubacteriaceae bacterium]
MFCANKMPTFTGDKGKHVYERIIPIKCCNPTIESEQDKHLLEKMYAEKESIVFLSMQEARKVVLNGYRYDLPNQALIHRAEYEMSNSIVRQFISECCEEFPIGQNGKPIRKGFSTVSKVYEAFSAWSKRAGEIAVSKSAFKKEASEILNVDETSLLAHKEAGSFFPFRLTLKAQAAYFSMHPGVDKE